MARKKIEVASEEAQEEMKHDKGSVRVRWNGGERVYSSAVHGKDYMALAEEFCTKHSGTVV